MTITDTQIKAARDLRLHFLNDRYRPDFHFVVPEDHAKPADPNGAIWWNGRYHLGYLYQHEGVHFWGHVSSRDLIHWRHHRPWLYPTADSPEEGIFSGNCFVGKDGEAVMTYHGVKVGNCIATSRDPRLDSWKKLQSNPIVPVEDRDTWRESDKLPYASWDPHGWLDGDTYYAIFGGTRPAVFRAESLDDWHYVGDLFNHGLDGVNLAEDLSCPDLFRLGDKWVLMGISHEKGCRYFIGDWRDEQFYPERHERLSWADNTLFAPESLAAPDGRRIMWAWIFDQWDDDTQAAAGWSGVFCLPRELWLRDDGRLGMRPVEELKTLRYNQHEEGARSLEAGTEHTVATSGTTLDIEIVIEPEKADRVGIKVCCAPDGSEETVVGYDRGAGRLFIDPSRASRRGMGLAAIEAAPFDLADGEALSLRVIVDKSVVEVFANDRQAVLRRIYPDHPQSQGLKLFSDGGQCRIERLSVWEMMPSNPY